MESKKRCWSTTRKNFRASPSQTATSEPVDEHHCQKRFREILDKFQNIHKLDENSTHHESDQSYTDATRHERKSEIGDYKRYHSHSRLRAMVAKECTSTQKPKLNENGEKLFTINRVNNNTATKSAKKLHIKRKSKGSRNRSDKFSTPLRRPQSAKKPSSFVSVRKVRNFDEVFKQKMDNNTTTSEFGYTSSKSLLTAGDVINKENIKSMSCKKSLKIKKRKSRQGKMNSARGLGSRQSRSSSHCSACTESVGKSNGRRSLSRQPLKCFDMNQTNINEKEDLKPHTLVTDGWKVKIIPYDSEKARRASDSRSRSRSKSKGSQSRGAQKSYNIKMTRNSSKKSLKKTPIRKSTFYKDQNCGDHVSSKSVLVPDCHTITISQFGDTTD